MPRRCGCLVTWFCYQLIAKPGNETTALPGPDPYELVVWKAFMQTVYYDVEFVSFLTHLILKHEQSAPMALSINSLRPSDAIWWHRSGSTLAQVMACCLMAPSHYLNQCWLIISKIQLHSSDGNFTRDTSHQWLKLTWKLLIYNVIKISQGPMS